MKVVLHDFENIGDITIPKYLSSIDIEWGIEFDLEPNPNKDLLHERLAAFLERVPGEIVIDVTCRKSLREVQQWLNEFAGNGMDLSKVTVLTDSLLYRNIFIHGEQGKSFLSPEHVGFAFESVTSLQDLGRSRNICWIPGKQSISFLGKILRGSSRNLKIFYLLDDILAAPRDAIDSYRNDAEQFERFNVGSMIPIGSTNLILKLTS